MNHGHGNFVRPGGRIALIVWLDLPRLRCVLSPTRPYLSGTTSAVVAATAPKVRKEAILIAMVVGEFQQHTRSAMQAAAQRAGAQCIFVSEVPRALTLLRSLDTPPRCILVSLKADISSLCESLRDSVEYYTIPLVGLVSYPSSESYQAANRQGADDSIPEYDMGGLTRRLANLVVGEAPHLPRTRVGRAIVAVSDEVRRRQVGRRLRSAGYEVDFISDESELPETNEANDLPSVLVATPSFLPTDAEGSKTRGDFANLPRVVVPRSDGDLVTPRELSPPEVAERLMFLVDEATQKTGHEARASRRIQHSTMCTFQNVRSFEHTYALSDNISRQGLYLRTLDPPAVGEDVRIHLRNRYGEILQIRGMVAWRHAPNRVGGRTCPGFGLSIQESACPPLDLSKYHALYDDVLKDLNALEESQRAYLSVAPERTSEKATGGGPSKVGS